MNKLIKTLSKAKRKLKAAAPTILSVTAVIGVGGAVVTTGIATPKAIEVVKADSIAKHDGDPNAYTKWEAVLSGWKFYIPTAVLTLSTMGCILTSNALNQKQQASLTAAYLSLSKTYSEYRKKASELYGSESDSEIRKSIAEDKFDDLEMPEEDDGLTLFYFEYGPGDGYFRSTKEDVLEAFYRFNRNFALRTGAPLNELLDFLGLDNVPEGDSIGWTYEAGLDDGYQWVDYFLDDCTTDDGLEYTIISFPFAPSTYY